ncbi:uncharacterized protein METZ01_LOCUS454815, partial [marine metagenome]
MHRYLSLLLFIGLAWGQNPCEDERYIKIKGKSLDDMSDREYSYFLKMEEKCESYQQINPKLDNVKSMKEPAVNNSISKVQQYEDYLIALGCEKRDGTDGINYYYYDAKKYYWKKIDDSWEYLYSLGYRKGENVNQEPGKLFKYDGRRWV